MSKHLGTAIFVRHGETDYTNNAHDLTETGVKTIQRAADALAHVSHGHELFITSSEAPRALSSARILRDRLLYRQEIFVSELLAPITIRDEARVHNILTEYRQGNKIPEHYYFRDPRFNDGLIVEPHHEISLRFRDYLVGLSEQFLSISIPHTDPIRIGVTHYECVAHFLRAIFCEDSFGFGELLFVSFYSYTNPFVRLEVGYRGKQTDVYFNTHTRSFIAS